LNATFAPITEPPMNATPVSLLERLKRPEDRDAWERFVQLYTPLLYGWARRTGLKENDAADLLQDVFTILVEQMPTFRYQPGGSFRAWLYTVLTNRWRELRRRKQLVNAASGSLETVPQPESPDLPGEAEERAELLARALTLLEPEFEPTTWQAFQQMVLQGRAGELVARDLGLSLNAVYIACSRVRKRLRGFLAGLLE
jgi:RNA polymerase sigma-70 factor (ECF subfamily)